MLNKIYQRFKRFKLTTRIAITNLILFVTLLMLIYFLVSLLTKQFIFMKNRDELLDKQRQINEYLAQDKALFEGEEPKEKIHKISQTLSEIRLFESSQFILFIHDNTTLNSYYYDPNYYKDRLQPYVPFEIKNMNLVTTYGERLIGDTFPHAFLDFEILHSFDGFDYKNVFSGTLPLPNAGMSSAVQSIRIGKEDLWYSTLRMGFEDGDTVFITLFLTPQLDLSFLTSLRTALILGSTISVFIIFFFGKALTKRALRPLVDLSYISQSIDNETLNYRIPTSGSNDEVDTLIKSLNLMLDNLEKSFNTQQRFVSDASHELRIPLTIILGYTDLLKNIGKDDPELLAESLSAIEDEAKNMNQLVERLLLIARLENNRLTANLEEIDLLLFMKKLKYECQKIYKDRDFIFQMQYKDGLYGDSELLKQIMRALIENAVKYAPESDIHIRTYEEKDTLVIAVVDFGPGIPSAELPLLTNRFYRVSADRNRTTGGTGLGLSIVNALLKVHHGYLQIESQEGKGTVMKCVFPKPQ